MTPTKRSVEVDGLEVELSKQKLKKQKVTLTFEFGSSRQVFDYSDEKVKIESGSFGTRRVRFHPELVAAVERADSGRNVKRHCFDVLTLTSGKWSGLQAIAIGSTVEKRKRSAKIALALAVASDSRVSTLQAARSKLQALQACIHVERTVSDLSQMPKGIAVISSSSSLVESLPDGWYKISNVKYKGALYCKHKNDKGIHEVSVAVSVDDREQSCGKDCWYLRQGPPGMFVIQNGKFAGGSLYCSNEKDFNIC